MTVNNNDNKKNLADKIAARESLNPQEISEDIHEQLQGENAPAPQTIEEIAKEEGLSPRELREDLRQQSTHESHSGSKKIWIIVAVIAIGLALWWLYKHYA